MSISSIETNLVLSYLQTSESSLLLLLGFDLRPRGSHQLVGLNKSQTTGSLNSGLLWGKITPHRECPGPERDIGKY